MADATLAVRGLRDLNRAFALADKETAKGLRKTLRAVAEPIRAESETRSVAAIPRVGLPWSRMRIGVTQKVVYVAPREKGRASRSNRSLRRPNLAGLLMDRAMEPALNANVALVERSVDAMLQDVGRQWEQV